MESYYKFDVGSETDIFLHLMFIQWRRHQNLMFIQWVRYQYLMVLQWWRHQHLMFSRNGCLLYFLRIWYRFQTIYCTFFLPLYFVSLYLMLYQNIWYLVILFLLWWYIIVEECTWEERLLVLKPTPTLSSLTSPQNKEPE